MFVLILKGCNKFNPEVLDVVEDEKLLENVTKWNQGVTPLVENGDFDEVNFKYDPDVNLYKFIVDSIDHESKELKECQFDAPTIFAVRKGDRSIKNIMEKV